MEGPSRLKDASREIFAGLARSYDVVLDVATLLQDRRWKGWVAQSLGQPGGLVLDVGCGTLVLEERIGGGQYVGVDMSVQMLRAGRMKPFCSVPTLVGGDAESLPFQDEAFDAVVSCYVPKYVDSSWFAGEIARVARPGAAAVIYDFARPRGAMSPFLQLYVQGGLRALGFGLGLARRPEAAAFDGLPWIIDGTRWDSELPRALEARGFRTIETRRLTGGAVFAYRGRKRS